MRELRPFPAVEPRDRFDAAVHDLANALSAARTYADVLALRAKAGAPADASISEAMLRELDRMNAVLREIRRDTLRTGDTLRCADCGYTFVNRRASGRPQACRRCSSERVERWKAVV